ncbi:phosphoribosyltransferase-like protein [Sideroxydans sp.]
MSESFENLKKRILILNEKVWEGRLTWPSIEEWLENFTGKVTDKDAERLHAVFWLSQFMYFGGREIRVLLKSMYRDLYLYPIIQEVRSRLSPTATESEIELAVRDELKHTRFIGVGNPSESGVHLLYYFRQENGLSKKLFIDSVQIFTRSSDRSASWPKKTFKIIADLVRGRTRRLRSPEVRRYVFLDDICGSGDTAIDYSDEILTELMRLNPTAKVSYYSLFATKIGLQKVEQGSLFGENCGAVYELDSSYRCLSDASRYLKILPKDIDRDLAVQLVKHYGMLLNPDYASGYKDSQMLMGFHHNTPDNTVGIIWNDSLNGRAAIPWKPVFKRYPKIYGESV